MGTIPPPPETKREPLPARRLQAGEGTKRNQMEGIPPAALDETRLRASLPTSNPNPGGTRDSGSRPPLAQETSGNGGRPSNSPISRDPEGPGSLSARSPSWGAPLRGRPPISALRVGEQLQEPRPSVRAWLGSRRRVPPTFGAGGRSGGVSGCGGDPPRRRRRARSRQTAPPRPAGPEGALSTPLPSLRAPGWGEPGACVQAESGPAGPGVQGGHGDPQARPPIAPASNGPRLRSVGRRPRTPGARLPAPGYGGRRGPIPAPLALRRPALCPPRSPAGHAARPEPRRRGRPPHARAPPEPPPPPRARLPGQFRCPLAQPRPGPRTYPHLGGRPPAEAPGRVPVSVALHGAQSRPRLKPLRRPPED
ncbi:basic salivary proline-rich protein 4-like [Bos indicus x Bos taurus]|uniref:basic salivary proline-rich protein 4-like n=1 Tax=Bos indicus x Bos taurus TaxID=30522 RepID=UPI000F7D4828|nr:basic salivary proline-rich protein 4-like [Bos indicus x Bos taurus]